MSLRSVRDTFTHKLDRELVARQTHRHRAVQKAIRAETEAAKKASLRASEHLSSMLSARSVADEKARKLREAADLAPPKSD